MTIEKATIKLGDIIFRTDDIAKDHQKITKAVSVGTEYWTGVGYVNNYDPLTRSYTNLSKLLGKDKAEKLFELYLGSQTTDFKIDENKIKMALKTLTGLLKEKE